jgi:3-hydroxyisobutyrate dehydrogenase-like beta-hydroxyacid dehydrogenase
MVATIKGHYEQGKIFLDEDASVTSKADVIITFLTNNAAKVSSVKPRLWA